MKQVKRDVSDRIARLRQRLGLPPKRWLVRVKPGGWITLPRVVVRSLRWEIGDAIQWKVTPEGLEVQRTRTASRRLSKCFKRPHPDHVEPTLWVRPGRPRGDCRDNFSMTRQLYKGLR